MNGKNIKNLSNLKINLLNVVFLFFPLSFILGNLFLNLNIIILIIFTYCIFQNKIFIFRKVLIDKIIFLFFGYIILIAIVNYIETFFFKPVNISAEDIKSINFYIGHKSLSFLRYLLLYFVVRYLMEEKILNLKWFFLTSSFLCLFVAFDVIYQFFFDKDIFGLIGNPRKLSGPFGDELIAGGYLQRFFLFIVFTIIIYFPKKINFYFIPFFTLVIFAATILSGNRMSLVLLIFSFLLLFFSEKKIRLYLFSTFIFSVLAFFIIVQNDDVNKNFKNFKREITQIVSVVYSLNSSKVKLPDHFMADHYMEFHTFYDTWKMNKYLGGGLRSFRMNCHYRDNTELYKTSRRYEHVKVLCNTHPHNYYLEIVTDLGLIGFTLSIVLFSLIFYQSFVAKKKIKSKFFYSDTMTLFIFIFITEMFPVKTTGSFFSTNNAAFIFLIIPILVTLSRKKIAIK